MWREVSPAINLLTPFQATYETSRGVECIYCFTVLPVCRLGLAVAVRQESDTEVLLPGMQFRRFDADEREGRRFPWTGKMIIGEYWGLPSCETDREMIECLMVPDLVIQGWLFAGLIPLFSNDCRLS